MGEIVVIVVPSFKGGGQVEVVPIIEEILFPAVIRKEQFALLCQIFVNAKAGFRGDRFVNGFRQVCPPGRVWVVEGSNI